jgi:hypothetical protein
MWAAIGLGIQAVGSIYGAIASNKQANAIRDNELKQANLELERMKTVYQNLDTSNPYLNMENTMEDLTINQKQADFERQTFQQSQANIMQGLQGAAGGSGIAALAQSLAQQGQLASQKASASIGIQERQNQMAQAQMAGQIQEKERAGDVYSRGLEWQKQGQLLNMARSDQQRYAQQEMALRQQGQQAIQEGFNQVGTMAGSWDAGNMTKKQLEQMGVQFTS